MLAHQGGGSEMLLIALPLALFAVVLFIANRRAQARLDADEGEHETADEDDG